MPRSTVERVAAAIAEKKGTVVAQDEGDRRRMVIALAANIAMFSTGVVGWRLADSTSLLADAFDMLADASGYLVALIAIGRSLRFKANAARWNGSMLVLLGAGVLAEVIHRSASGSEPRGLIIVAFATLSLAVNSCVLAMLWRYRYGGEIHLKATWIDTRADVVINAGVLVSGVAIWVTGYRVIDLIVAPAIAAYVIREGFEILEDARGSEIA
jgi:cation diffusion facilitator family transporter